MTPQPKRRIGSWLHHTPETPQKADEIVDGLKERGVNVLIASFKNWTGPTFFPSEHAYTEEGFEDGKMLRYTIDKCHDAGIEFEAWTCTFPEAGRSRLIEQHPELRVLCRDGSEYRVEGGDGEAWACPAQDATQDYEYAICREVLEKYPGIDALHLDYIRYPFGDTCYCKACRQEFREKFGYDLLEDAMSSKGREGEGFDAYVRWRCAHITRFVQRAHELTREFNVKLTAAVFPFYPSIMYDIGQNWIDWCEKGILDTAYPMNYNRSDLMVGRYTQMHTALLKGTNTLLCEGLSANGSVAELRKRAQAALDNGANGLVFFSAPPLLKLPADVLAPFCD